MIEGGLSVKSLSAGPMSGRRSGNRCQAVKSIGKIKSAKPIVIGENVWIGGAAIILAGVTVVDNAVIRPASVAKDRPPAVLAGEPCASFAPYDPPHACRQKVSSF